MCQRFCSDATCLLPNLKYSKMIIWAHTHVLGDQVVSNLDILLGNHSGVSRDNGVQPGKATFNSEGTIFSKMLLGLTFRFVPQHFFDRGLQEWHASHIRGLRNASALHYVQHLASQRGLHLGVTGQLVQSPGHGAGDLETGGTEGFKKKHAEETKSGEEEDGLELTVSTPASRSSVTLL